MVANDVSVHSASWGASQGDGAYDWQAYEMDTNAYENDILLVASAGNEGPYLVSSPATAKNCISVGASLSDQANFPHYDAGQRAAAPYLYSFGSVASFSSVGPTEDGRRAPTVVAPGVSVQVAYALADPAPGHEDYVYGDGAPAPAPR